MLEELVTITVIGMLAFCAKKSASISGGRSSGGDADLERGIEGVVCTTESSRCTIADAGASSA